MTDVGFINKHFIGGMVSVLAMFLCIVIYRIKYPNSFGFNNNRDKVSTILYKIGHGGIIDSLNEHELQIASQLVDPSNIDVTFDDIAGLDSVVDSFKTDIILPLLINQKLREKSRYFPTPKGVLLHGPPGCGKTMLAKATAKMAMSSFINLEIPMLTQKMYGESQKLAKAVFTLADKLKPCIIFIDEIDTFLRSRGQNDHEATAMIKAQFMILWDGLFTGENDTGIIVMGATNRPQDVDAAIIRRMPMVIGIPLPNRQQRLAILNKCKLDASSISDLVNFKTLATDTQGFSASDLKELCRYSNQIRLREQSAMLMKIVSDSNSRDDSELVDVIDNIRGVNAKDFELALKFIKNSKNVLNAYDKNLTIDKNK